MIAIRTMGSQLRAMGSHRKMKYPAGSAALVEPDRTEYFILRG